MDHLKRRSSTLPIMNIFLRLAISLSVALAALVFALFLLHLPARAAAWRANILVNPGDSIQSAINVAQTGDVVIINPGIYTESLTLNKPISLLGASSDTTIIHGVSDQRVLTVSGSPIQNTVLISGLTFFGGNITGTTTCPQACGGGVLITNAAQPHLQNLVFVRNWANGLGGGLYAAGPLSLTNVTFKDNAAFGHGGAVYAAASLEIDQAQFENNRCLDAGCSGGGIYAADQLTLDHSDFISNSSNMYGGGGYALGVTRLDGGYFIRNWSGIQSGGLRVEANLYLTDTEFISNTSGNNAGGASAPVAFLNGGKFVGNSAWILGGALRVNSLTLSGTEFISNTATSSGGAIMDFGDVTILGGRFSGNRSTAGQGGAVYAGSVWLSGTIVEDNYAAYDGGGIFLTQGGTIVASQFTANRCDSYCSGGGLYATEDLVIVGSRFISNTASEGGGSNSCLDHGGGIYVGGQGEVGDSEFTANLARCEGGGIYAGGPIAVSGSRFEHNRELAESSGGLHANNTLWLSATMFFSNTGGARSLGSAEVINSSFLDNSSGGLGTHQSVRVTSSQFIRNIPFGLLASGSAIAFNSRFERNGCFNDSCMGGGMLVGGMAVLHNTNLITNSAGNGDGGGLLASGDALVSGSRVLGNSAGRFGGGLYVNGALTLTQSEIGDNTALAGGGLYQAGGGPARIVNTLFRNNTAQDFGAALAAWNGPTAPVDLMNLTIVANGINPKSAILILQRTAYVTNTIVTSHAIGIEQYLGNVYEDHNLFWHNNLDFSGVITSGGNSRHSDPRFLNPVLADYHLASNSEAIDRGSPIGVEFDFEGDPRDQLPDIGYDEFIHTPITNLTAQNDGPTRLGNTTWLSATARGTGIQYQWDFGDGGTSATGQAVNHLYDAVGVYTAAVTAMNGLGTIAATTLVTVTKDLPMMNLKASSDSPTILGHGTWFTATADGSNIVYTWDFGDGAADSGNPISHTYSARGFYTAIATATNGANSLTAKLPVTITNLAPVAVAGSDQSVIVNSRVDLDGSNSYDQDGHMPLAYQWTQIGGPVVLLSSAVISRPTFLAPAAPSVVTFTLRVTDAYGLASALDAVAVYANDQVITGFQADNSSPIKVGQSVSFTATIRTGSHVAYRWNFGDGIVTGPMDLHTITHAYTRYGLLTAIVTATNQSGSNVAETLVMVQPYSIYIPILRKDP